MVEQAEREPTMDEIVVALREAKRGVGGAPPLTVVGGQDGIDRNPNMWARRYDSAPAHNSAQQSRSPIDPVTLRDQEVERLLAENARLNQRVMFLISAIEQERTHNTTAATADDTIEAIRAAAGREVRNALEAELRPLLLAVLRLLEKRPAQPAASSSGDTNAPAGAPCAAPKIRQAKRKAEHPATPAMPSEWLLELIGKLDAHGTDPMQQQAVPAIRPLTSPPSLRGKLVRLFQSNRH